MSEPNVNEQPKASPVVACSDLLAHAVSQLQEQENLSRAIGAKCKKKKNATMAKYYEGQADAFKQVRDYLCANVKVSDPRQ